MSLRLPATTGLSSEERETLQIRWNTVDKVEERLKMAGLEPELAPPFARPTLTAEQLTTTVNHDYTTLYAHHLAWVNYLVPMVAQVKARLLAFHNELKNIESRMRKELRQRSRLLPKEERLNEKDIETEIWNSPEFLDARREEQRLEQTRLEMEGYLEVMENNLKVISRQVEIRKIEIGGAQVENNMGRRGWREGGLRRP